VQQGSNSTYFQMVAKKGFNLTNYASNMNSLRPCFSSSATNCTTPSELDHAVASSSLQHHSYKPRAAVQIRLLLCASLPPSCGALAMRSLARPPRPPDHHGRIIMLLASINRSLRGQA
jgi:hypothetical protein